ncbi:MULTISPECIES: phosphatidylserine/phosphatidylglycerophosphate/cardiolipin synthase family protein [unclassified Fusibacter]|uniref:phospholipase D-like domain-containing protein n=1 Tax=unclassified Fusibacter TaxID=2624464 RepID=UPI001012F251|nr:MULTISPECIES: phosphatidylserine/phosphatidylglycerophosphate/cardiolipin synthase family protein [unclassified Fusibacter]MCK8060434.1 phosphatidylserine/phosphatidylglycerophosphate/cardiolipin synthase family protein [Fusibacter sp. A2]NPE20277.1 phosphatidylserine/phosphatidylglycerophosphate/cardiolipin synthase family protein [Fusibacter sp. A1]RXV63483.1 phosphatidylserine/phosphatidylglycerophosphate/cardiolipin synthase family protein [Fusibacter sp. A1]
MDDKFFTDGQTAFSYLIDSIDQAKSTIEIQMFIWRNDELGNLIARALLRAADRGVRIVVSVDMMGSIFEYAEESKQSFFHHSIPMKLKFGAWLLNHGYPVKGKPSGFKQKVSALSKAMSDHDMITILASTLQKNHSKYMVIDGSLLIISGMNIEYKEWKHDLCGRKYYDYMVAFSSRAKVEQFYQSLQNGGDVNRSLSDSENSDIDFIVNVNHEGKSLFNAKTSLLDRLNQAKTSIDIVMAYIGDQDILNALTHLSQQGIKIRLYIPEAANLQNDLNRYYLKQLMRSTENRIDVYLCKNMIHGKLILIDNSYLTFGSLNLNRQAMNLLQETNIGFYPKSFGMLSALKENIMNIEKDSTPIGSWRSIEYNKTRCRLEKVFEAL